MHPAPSLIAFTTLTGLGFGLVGWLGAGWGPAAGWRAGALAALALGLAAAGLLASLFHLGQPRRFLKAFSQWRSSWLSREAILATATLAVFTGYAALWTFGLRVAPLGWAAAGLAAATVFCTAMIYAQMRSVPRWRTPLTPAVFLLAAAAGGGLLAGAYPASAFALAAFGVVQVVDWARGDGRFARSGTTLATATGLGRFGAPRAFAPPHTGPNYLTREMVFVIGRRHAQKLSMIGFALAIVAPLAIVLLTPPAPLGFALAALVHAAGVATLRWLFFAQAEHVIGLYYGLR